MNIQGLQKLTLLDYPGHTACTVFTGGCNLRCPFCHNVPLVLDANADAPISQNEIFELLEKRRGTLDGVAITGGEPLIQPGIEDFMRKIKDMGFKVKLDTNGAFPEKLKNIINSSLVDYVAMDVKNRLEKYAVTTGVDNIDTAPFAESIKILLEGKTDYEFRTTVIKELHTAEDIEAVGDMIFGAKNYFLQKFKDSGILLENSSHAVEDSVMHRFACTVRQKVQHVGVRGL